MFVLAALCLTAFFLSLSAAMLVLAHPLYVSYDLWFGTDIPRYIAWATDPANVFRSHLHPLSFLLYRALGVLLTLLHVRTHLAIYLVCDFPPALMASVAILTSARIVPPERRLLAVLGSLTIGSVLFFAPIPESHTLGGAFLLLEGSAVFWTLHGRSREPADAGAPRAAVWWCCAAVGVTISNALPGLLLLLPLWHIRADRRALLRRLGMAALLILLLEIIAHVFQVLHPYANGMNNLSEELNWLIWPTWDSCRESATSLFLHLFGLPPVQMTPHGTPLPDQAPYLILYPHPEVVPVQSAAAACWCLGVGLAWKRASTISHILTTQCLLAVLGLAAFASFYDTYESFMVSVHIWPLLLLPTLLILREAPTLRFPSALLITASIFLSVLQTCRAFPHVFSLLSRL